MHAFENPAGPDASRRDSVSPSVARPTSVVPAPSARTTAPDHRLRRPPASEAGGRGPSPSPSRCFWAARWRRGCSVPCCLGWA